jgi:uncharacterized membrane protein
VVAIAITLFILPLVDSADNIGATGIGTSSVPTGTGCWLVSIVFLPFPSELIGSAQNGARVVHGVYIGTCWPPASVATFCKWPRCDGRSSKVKRVEGR